MRAAKERVRKRLAARYRPLNNRPAPYGITEEEMRRAQRPSIAEAAAYLRQLAHTAHLSRDDDDERERAEKLMRARLWAIANCIEGVPRWRWRKASDLHLEQARLLEAVAKWVPEEGVTLGEHDENLARDIAIQWGLQGPDDYEAVRDLIVETRKRWRRNRRGK